MTIIAPTLLLAWEFVVYLYVRYFLDEPDVEDAIWRETAGAWAWIDEHFYTEPRDFVVSHLEDFVRKHPGHVLTIDRQGRWVYWMISRRLDNWNMETVTQGKYRIP